MIDGDYMNKKGFTLVELMAVIIILGVVLLLVLPAVDKTIKNSKQTAYKAQLDRIKKASSDWAISNAKYLPNEEGDSIVIYLGELKTSGLIDVNIKNPINNKILSNNSSITITKSNGNYVFDINLITLDSNESSNAPILIISGNIIDYIEVSQDSTTYTIPSVIAKDSDGNVISPSYVSYQIIKGSNVVSSINTNQIGSYKIIYTVTYNGESASYEKIVEVRDTTNPILSITSSINARVGETINYNSGVSVSDNSGEVITASVDYSGVGSTPGTYYAIYEAEDSSGNKVTKKREVVIHN